MTPGPPPPVALTTVIVPLGFAEPAVAGLRTRHDWWAPLGVPAHITVFGPWVDPDEVTPGLLGRLRETLGDVSSWAVTLGELALLGDAACLIASPVEPLVALTERVHALCPQLQRPRLGYQLTVARRCDAALYERLDAQLSPQLPLIAQATSVTVLASAIDGPVRGLAEQRLKVI